MCDNSINSDVIKEFLENAVLYSEKKYSSSADRLPHVSSIESYCDECKISRPFRNTQAKPANPHSIRAEEKRKFLGNVIDRQDYRCADCEITLKTYFIRAEFLSDTISISKCGEFPRAELKTNHRVAEFFEDDQKLYRQALLSLSNGFGVGAFAYLRQIVEKNIVKLIDLIESEVSNGDAAADVIKAFADLGERKGAPMSKTILVANYAMPDYLIHNGLNPLVALYKTLSEGIHGKTDNECLRLSNNILNCLDLLISELANRKRFKEKFAANVQKVATDS